MCCKNSIRETQKPGAAACCLKKKNGKKRARLSVLPITRRHLLLNKRSYAYAYNSKYVDLKKKQRRNNQAALAAALSTPIGAAAQAAAGIPAMMGGTPAMSTAGVCVCVFVCKPRFRL
jgi:hypothetical protein